VSGERIDIQGGYRIGDVTVYRASDLAWNPNEVPRCLWCRGEGDHLDFRWGGCYVCPTCYDLWDRADWQALDARTKS
jgi:hypothetical protein